MNDNIYGGITIPSSPFIFDKIYNNYAAAKTAASIDGVMCGRYVLIQYCESLLDYNDRTQIENLFSPPIENGDKQKYYNNFVADNRMSYDRVVLQKIVNNDIEEYRIMCCLHPISANGYTDDIMSAIGLIQNLNITNGVGTGSIQTTNAVARGQHSIAGSKGQATGDYGVAFGENAMAMAEHTVTLGYNTQALYPFETVFGQYNKMPYASAALETLQKTVALYPILEIGTGILEEKNTGMFIDRSNNIVQVNTPNSIDLIRGWRAEQIETTQKLGKIYKVTITVSSLSGLYLGDGTAEYPYEIAYEHCAIWDQSGIIPNTDCKIIALDIPRKKITIEFNPLKTTTEAGNIQGLYIEEALALGPDPLFGINNIISGAPKYYSLGHASCQLGNNTRAFGEYSFAEGVSSRAYGKGSHAEGALTLATGMYSHSSGYETQALGKYSFSTGYKTQASNTGAIAVGSTTLASGQYSLAGGWGTQVSADYATVLGKFNSNDTNIFTVGIGTSDTARYDGLTVFNSGIVAAPCATIAKINSADENALITKEYLSYIPQELVPLFHPSMERIVSSGRVDKGKIIWCYTKWSNGKAEVWGRLETKQMTKNTVFTTESQFGTFCDFPFEFLEQPYIWTNRNHDYNSHQFYSNLGKSGAGNITTTSAYFATDLKDTYNEIYLDIYMIGQWCSNTITFMPNGGVLTSPGYNIMSSNNPTNIVGVKTDYSYYALMTDQDIPTREGFSFLGWYTHPIDGDMVYDANGHWSNDCSYWGNTAGIWKGTKNLIVYAHWARSA